LPPLPTITDVPDCGVTSVSKARLIDCGPVRLKRTASACGKKVNFAPLDPIGRFQRGLNPAQRARLAAAVGPNQRVDASLDVDDRFSLRIAQQFQLDGKRPPGSDRFLVDIQRSSPLSGRNAP